MSDGYQVHTGEVATAGEQTDGKAQEAEGIRSKVDAANGKVPSQAWGLLGDLTVYNWYQQVYGTFSDHVDKMISGVQKLADDIKTTAQRYDQNEDEVGKSFSDIENELGSAPKPPSIGKAS